MGRASYLLLASLAVSTVLAQSDLHSKRGLAYHGDDHESDNQLLTSENSLISWYYTWSSWPAQGLNNSIAFLPLIHGVDDAKDAELRPRLNRLPESSTHLLTFNEPDGSTGSGGSNIDPEDAAKAYIENIIPLRDSDSRRWNISHPVVTGSPQGLEWLRKFNESCYDIDDNGCPTDFVAVHWYGDAIGLQNWLGSLRDFYNETSPDLKFWITEMALPKQDSDATLAMMNQSLTFLDDADYVEGYAWFGAFRKNEANEWTGDDVSLFDNDGGLTELGALYLGGDERGFAKGQKGSFASSVFPTRLLLWTAMLAAVLAVW
ncbi:Alkali-sensitive linkage protein 1-like protein 1 [Colletotrichum truncatum]|uniref:Alkali-sensitive linkage protein 1-like protein 1 n=1 Tax=Colletotrichum truncatum TaxID=5467 RepID=A0ACC3Z8W8_COLTU|nr:Alkali-sensitive linkage protein 1-like protein 1 [Colletotrichum truncatum]KAF6780801.1 Alkali-sensitive linkage protein 1-like protein 1 [Colletotrichum truncatum]